MTGSTSGKVVQSSFFVLGVCSVGQEPIMLQDAKTGETYSRPYLGYAGMLICVDCARKLGFVVEAPIGKTLMQALGVN